MSTKISEIFDVMPAPNIAIAAPVVTNDKLHDDADLARANLRSLMQTTSTALQHALDVAIQSENPRAYEVLSQLITTSANLNTSLIDIHSKEMKTNPVDKPVTQNVTNNVVFTGTTSELNKLIMNKMGEHNETS